MVKKSAENIIRALEDKFEALKLPRNLHKTITFTTDQGSDIKKALENHSRINCMAHVLNLVLTHTFDRTILRECAPHVSDVITKCISLVGYLERSGMTHVLESSVKQERSSSWNTKYDACFSVHQNFDAVEDILEKFGESHRLLGIDKYLLDRILVFLQLFNNVTFLMESEKKPTIHLVLLHMHILKEKLHKLRDEESNNEMRSIVAHCLDTVFDVTFIPHRIHKIAAFLWPEYKQLRYLNDLEREEVYSIVKEELSNIIKTNDTDDVPSRYSSDTEILTDNGEEVDIPQDDILNKYKDIHTVNDGNSETKITVEMELYKNSNYRDNNILHWWKVREKEFPLLAKLARHILCIPASIAASERCFGSANRILEET